MNYTNRFHRLFFISVTLLSLMNTNIGVAGYAFNLVQTVTPSSIARQVLFPTDTCLLVARDGFITTYPIPAATCPTLGTPTDTAAPVTAYSGLCVAYINGLTSQALALTDYANGILNVYAFGTDCVIGGPLQPSLSITKRFWRFSHI